MIEFALHQKPNPRDLTAPRKYYAVSQYKGNVSLREIATRIARESTVSLMDTLAVLEGLLQVMPEFLLDAKIIKLAEFGSFRLSISSGGSDTEEDFDTSLIRKAKVIFRPGQELKKLLSDVNYKKVD